MAEESVGPNIPCWRCRAEHGGIVIKESEEPSWMKHVITTPHMKCEKCHIAPAIKKTITGESLCWDC